MGDLFTVKRVISVILMLCFVSVCIPSSTAAVSSTTVQDLRLTEAEVQATVTELRTATGSNWAESGGSTATVIVAASDSSAAAKAEARYVCDGSNDHVEIQAALNALPASGGTVLLKAGTYNCAGNLQPGVYKTLKGEGETATILKFPGDGGLRIRAQYVTFADFKVTGKADMLIETNHARVRNVTMTVDNSRIGVFYVWAANKVVEDVEFVNCKAIDCGRYGFLNSGEGSPNLIKNVRYVNCEAINCGRYSSVSTGPWVTGFDILEKNNIDGAWIVGCYAEGNQESGFHLEGFSYLSSKNVHFKDCVSINNAQKGKDKCMFGAGFTVPKGCTLENCYSYNNKHGYLVSGGSVSQCSDDTFINCRDDASWYGFVVRHGHDISMTGCISNDAVRQGIVLSKAWNMKVEDFYLNGAAGYPLHTGSSTVTAAKFAATTASDDPFAYSMWNGPLTDSTIDIHAQNCKSSIVLCFENAQRVKVTGTIATTSTSPIKVIGGSAVDTSGVVVGSDVVTPTPTPTPTPVENPEYLWYEAEAVGVTAPMAAAADAAASGGSYVWVPEGSGHSVEPPAAEGTATYRISVAEAGTYAVYTRCIAPDSASDSFWVSVDGAAAFKYAPVASEDWQWSKVGSYPLAAGEHTVKVMWREDGTKLDKVFVSNDLAYLPTGMGGEATGPVVTPTPTPTPSPTPTPTPTPAEPQTWIEMESAALASPMVVASDAAASGGKYVWTPAGTGNRATVPTDGSATVTFTVSEAGMYAVHGRTLAADSTDDSFWVSIDGGAAFKWEPGTSQDWIWNKIGSYPLSAGKHTVKVMLREDGTKIDKIVVSSDPAFVPEGTGDGTPIVVPVQQDIVIEAESGSLVAPMQALNDVAASGGKYVVIPAGSGECATPPTTGAATYTFDVSAAGEYAVHGLTLAPSSTDDSFWVSVDGAAAFKWEPGNSQTWTWNKVGQYNLPAGKHTLKVMWREDGTKLDKLLLTGDLATVPTV